MSGQPRSRPTAGGMTDGLDLAFTLENFQDRPTDPVVLPVEVERQPRVAFYRSISQTASTWLALRPCSHYLDQMSLQIGNKLHCR